MSHCSHFSSNSPRLGDSDGDGASQGLGEEL